jgi:hypothetical protein
MSGGNTIATETFRQSITQAMRTLANEIETDVANIYQSASRAVGTAGTTPFASDLSAAALVLKELLDNGAPQSDLNLVINTAAGVKLRSQITVTNSSQRDGGVAAQGLATGGLWDLFGLQTRESAKVVNHTKGAGTGYDIIAAGEAVGQTTLSLEGGTVNVTGIKAGDIAVIGSDTNKYVVNTGLTAVSGDIVIGKPGLLVAAADADEVVLGNSYAANVALYRGAAVLVVRPPAIEATPLIQTQIVMDDKTGLPFMVCRVLGDGLTTWRVHACWGYKVVQPEFVINLLG